MRLRGLRRRLSRIDDLVPQTSPSDQAEALAIVLRVAAAVERWAAQQPGYRAIPAALMPESEGAAFRAWDGRSLAKVVTLNPAYAGVWLERLGRHLQRPGWQAFVEDLGGRLESIGRVIAAWARGENPPAWHESTFADIALDELAEALGTAAPPAWMPGPLLDVLRSRAKTHAEAMAMTSEQRWKRMRELADKAAPPTRKETN